jgi:hypothetical protein
MFKSSNHDGIAANTDNLAKKFRAASHQFIHK